MNKTKILVTGATGKTGRALVRELISQHYPVRALVRKEDARSLELRQLGAEVVVANMFNPVELTRAVQGTQRAYYVPLMHPHMIQAASAFLVAAQEAKLEQIVQMSQWTSNALHPTPMTQQMWLVDRLFSMAPGVGHTLFNPGMFADNFLRVMDFAALLGIFPILMGSSQSAPISNEDMARAAAALMIQGPELHAGRSYRPTGTELLTGRDMARIVAGVVGHPVLPVDLPLWMFRKVARLQKVDPYSVYLLTHYIEDAKLGAFALGGGVTEVMERLTGRPAESFETTARRYAAQPFARQSVGNRLKALANFMITPLVPGYQFRNYAAELQFPNLVTTEYCMQNSEWNSSREIQMQEQGVPASYTPARASVIPPTLLNYEIA